LADEKIIHFTPPKEEDSDEERSITQIKQLARRATSALEIWTRIVRRGRRLRKTFARRRGEVPTRPRQSAAAFRSPSA
jgi:hypothetical protein